MAYNLYMENFESRNSGNIDSSLPQYKLDQKEREELQRKGMSGLEIDQFVARKTLELQEAQLEKEGMKKEGEGRWAA